jgi:hypothetical protein
VKFAPRDGAKGTGAVLELAGGEASKDDSTSVLPTVKP